MGIGRTLLRGALFLAATSSTVAQAEDVASFSWLSGRWAVLEGDRWTEEHWSAPKGGIMLGTGVSGRGDKADNYEFMRIARGQDGTIIFWGSPNSQSPVPFKLVRLTHQEASFENPANDFPTRISYRREGNRLHATIAGPQEKGVESWTYVRAD